MSLRMFKLLIFGALIASALASAAGSASATNWSSNGPVSFTATAPASKFAVGATTINCSGGGMTGQFKGPAGPVNTSTWFGAATLTPTFTSCTAGGIAATTACNGGSTGAMLDAVALNSGVTSGTITTIGCSVTASTCVITVTGTAPGSYGNATHQVEVSNTGQALKAVWDNNQSICRTIFSTSTGSNNSGAGTFTNSAGADLAYTVTSTSVPTIGGGAARWQVTCGGSFSGIGSHIFCTMTNISSSTENTGTPMLIPNTGDYHFNAGCTNADVPPGNTCTVNLYQDAGTPTVKFRLNSDSWFYSVDVIVP